MLRVTLVEPTSCAPQLFINGVGACLGIFGQVRLHHSAPLERPVFNHPATRHGIPLEGVRSTEHREVGQTDFFRAPGPRVGDSKKVGLDGLLADVKLEITSVVQLGPLQFAVIRQQRAADLVGRCDGDVLTTRARAGNGGAGKFDPDASFPRGRVILMFAEPDQITDPVGMRIPGNDDVVANLVFVEGLESSVPVGVIAIPSIVVERIDVTVRLRLVKSREDCQDLASLGVLIPTISTSLRPNHSPCRPSL